MAVKDTDHGFEWVVSENGFEVEAEKLGPPRPEPAPQSTKPRELWHLPRRLTWQYVVLPTIAVIAAVWGYVQWRDGQTQEQIRHGLVISGAQTPAHLPLNFLRPAELPADAPQLQSLTPLDDGSMRVNATYTFVAPDGAKVKFVVPLRFERRDDLWSFAGALTDPSPDSLHKRSSPHLDLRYLGSDVDFMMETLGPYLDEVLTTACEAWTCAEDTRVSLDFTRPATARRADNTAYAGGAADDPLLLHILSTGGASPSRDTLALPPPHVAGYPADDESLQLYRRTIALQTLMQLTRVISPAAETPPDNLMFYALLIRQAARWRLESPEILAIPGDGKRLSIESLSLPAGGVESGRTLRGVLALLDELLRGQPQEIEDDIFRTARERGDTFVAMFKLLGELGERGIKPEEILRRMQRVLDPADGGAWRLQPTFRPELILTCDTGLYAYGSGRVQRLLPSPAEGPGLWAADWSPDGRRLALGTFFLSFSLDLETGETRWTPDVSGEALSVPVGFTAGGALAYHRLAWPSDSVFDFAGVEWRVFEPGSIAPARTGARGKWSMGFLPFQAGPSLSPDRQWAVVAEQPGASESGLTRFSVIPAEGGASLGPRTAYMPAWSPDSRLAYFSPTTNAATPLQLMVWDDVKTQETRTILTFDWQPASGSESPQVVWSPAGDRLAFILGTDDAERVALGVIAPNGEGLQLIGVDSSAIEGFAFSPDSQVLAVQLSEQEQHNLILYDSSTLRPIRTLIGWWRDFSWAPDGQVLLFNGSGVFTLNAPTGLRLNQPARLMDGNCRNPLWRPTAPGD